MHKSDELQARTRNFAVRIIRLCRALPACAEGEAIRRQLVGCGTSVAANYRSACRSRSTAEFLSRISIVLEEADESAFWLGIIADSSLIGRKRMEPLMDESMQLVRIFATRRTIRAQIRNQRSEIRNRDSA